MRRDTFGFGAAEAETRGYKRRDHDERWANKKFHPPAAAKLSVAESRERDCCDCQDCSRHFINCLLFNTRTSELGLTQE